MRSFPRHMRLRCFGRLPKTNQCAYRIELICTLFKMKQNSNRRANFIQFGKLSYWLTTQKKAAWKNISTRNNFIQTQITKIPSKWRTHQSINQLSFYSSRRKRIKKNSHHQILLKKQKGNTEITCCRTQPPGVWYFVWNGISSPHRSHFSSFSSFISSNRILEISWHWHLKERENEKKKYLPFILFERLHFRIAEFSLLKTLDSAVFAVVCDLFRPLRQKHGFSFRSFSFLLFLLFFFFRRNLSSNSE